MYNFLRNNYRAYGYMQRYANKSVFVWNSCLEVPCCDKSCNDKMCCERVTIFQALYISLLVDI